MTAYFERSRGVVDCEQFDGENNPLGAVEPARKIRDQVFAEGDTRGKGGARVYIFHDHRGEHEIRKGMWLVQDDLGRLEAYTEEDFHLRFEKMEE